MKFSCLVIVFYPNEYANELIESWHLMWVSKPYCLQKKKIYFSENQNR